MRQALILTAFLLTACAGRAHIIPGLTLKCDGHCRVYPANLGRRPEPGQQPFPAP